MQAQLEKGTEAELPRVLTAEEARTVMRLGRSTFYEQLRLGNIPCAVRIGAQWRIPTRSFIAWLEEGGLQEKAASGGAVGVQSNEHKP